MYKNIIPLFNKHGKYLSQKKNLKIVRGDIVSASVIFNIKHHITNGVIPQFNWIQLIESKYNFIKRKKMELDGPLNLKKVKLN